MPAVELSGVTKRYGVRQALCDVNLSVEQGSALGLLGPNGAGKTTALRLMLGFARPTREVMEEHKMQRLKARAKRATDTQAAPAPRTPRNQTRFGDEASKEKRKKLGPKRLREFSCYFTPKRVENSSSRRLR